MRLDQRANPVVVWLGLVSRLFVEFQYISVPLFGPVVVTSWPTLGSSLVLIRLVRVGTPVTLTFIVTSLQKGSQRRTKRIWCCWNTVGDSVQSHESRKRERRIHRLLVRQIN